jgi:hypothetical protein
MAATSWSARWDTTRLAGTERPRAWQVEPVAPPAALGWVAPHEAAVPERARRGVQDLLAPDQGLVHHEVQDLRAQVQELARQEAQGLVDLVQLRQPWVRQTKPVRRARRT